MAAQVGEQIGRYLRRQEEQRCRALEAEFAKDEVTRDRIVTRREVPNWVRPHRNALCQEADLLSMIEEHDYELADVDFRAYCTARGVLHVAGEFGTRQWEYFANHAMKRDEYIADPYWQDGRVVNGARHRRTPEEMEIGWSVVLLGRAKLQDCWELYRGA